MRRQRALGWMLIGCSMALALVLVPGVARAQAASYGFSDPYGSTATMPPGNYGMAYGSMARGCPGPTRRSRRRTERATVPATRLMASCRGSTASGSGPLGS